VQNITVDEEGWADALFFDNFRSRKVFAPLQSKTLQTWQKRCAHD